MIESSRGPLEASGYKVEMIMVIMAVWSSPTQTDAWEEAENRAEDGRDLGYIG